MSISLNKIEKKAFHVKDDTTSHDNESRKTINISGHCGQGHGRGRNNGING